MTYVPRAGDYGVTRTGGFFGRLIRLGTFSHWNHAFIYLGDGKIIEATPRGVVVGELSQYSIVVWNRHDDLTDDERAGVVAYAMSRLGEPYGFIDIAVIVLRQLGLKAFSVKISAFLDKRHGVICSQFASLAFRAIKRALTLKADNLVTPEDLAERVLFL
jgi:uncharacterized protein YycO